MQGRAKIFSERYAAAIRTGKLFNEPLVPEFRERIAETMAMHNCSIRVQRDPDDNWSDNSDVMTETIVALAEHIGSAAIPQCPDSPDTRRPLIELVRSSPIEHVFDALELMHGMLFSDHQEAFATRLRVLFETETLPWRLFRGEIIKLDEGLIGTGDTQAALGKLAAGPFAGAAAEYGKALSELATGESKDAIFEACKSLESTLQVLTGLEHANADRLVKALAEQGYLDDLPESVRTGFGNAVLMCLPFLRNKLGGHGQGSEILSVPDSYGRLALQLGAALQNFLIAKYLEKNLGAGAPDGDSKVDDVPY